MLKVMLADDEVLARNRLRRMIDEQPEYQVVAEATNGHQAIELVEAHNPDIILMDIRMPGMDGLQASRHLSELANPPAIIFCTAYDEYAISAFDVQAVGYVLKPVRQAALLQAMARAQGLSRLQLDALPRETRQRSQISVNTPVGIELLALDEISHFRADHKYVSAYCCGRERIVDETLKVLEEEFGERLLRIHRNCLVSVAHIEALQRSKSGQSQLRMRGFGEPLAVSRRHLGHVKIRLQKL